MNDKSTRNPFKIPVSTKPEGAVEEKEGKIEQNNAPAENISKNPPKVEVEDDDAAIVKFLNVKMAPSLHQSFKLFCTTRQISMQDYVLNFIKKEVKKNK